MKIYLFSGLGADERVFANLDLSGYEPVFIQWIQPLKNESIEAYALRLTEQIHDKNPVLIGVSFGGIVAIEVARHIPAEKIILIASAKNKNEIPGYYRLAGTLQLDRLVPALLLKHSNVVSNWFFGTSTTDERQLLKNILRETNSAFLKWALRSIVKWENSRIPENLVHIHGTKDRLLPFRKNRGLIPIKDGGHLMTLNKAEEISSLLKEILPSKNNR